MAQRRLVVWVAHWALQIAQAGYPPDAPAALASGQTILDVSPVARRAGVRPRMRVRQARAILPHLALLPPDPDRSQRAFDRVLHALHELRWDVSAWRPGLAVAPLGRLSSDADEEQLMEQAGEVIAYHTGADASVGIADGTLAGIVAAHRGLRVAPDEQAAFLAPLPTTWLPLVYEAGPHRRDVAEFVDQLRQLGIRQLGDIRRLPAGSLAARFGAAGELVTLLARGEDWPLHGRACGDDDVARTRECDPPLRDSGQVVFLAKHLADDLLDDLSQRGLTLTRLRITCTFGLGEHRARTWVLDPPPRSRDIVTRVRWHVDEWLGEAGAVTGGVHALTLTALAVLPLAELTPSLWGDERSVLHTRRAHAAATHITRLVGSDGVTRLHRQGGFDPRSRVRPHPWDAPPPPLAPEDAPWRGAVCTPAPTLLWDTPRGVGVRDGAGNPVTIDEDGELSAPPAVLDRSIGASCPIGEAYGPYPVNGAWWRGHGDADTFRAYLIVRCEGDALLLVYRQGRWWHEGTYEDSIAVLR
ncbi:hypothetical protein H8R18_03725 [Nanchangia anserum]|uniref:UmuC domain-containing protein n=1 Tax=Nanchangia anserum TaxID=2692125 RepID=A0A8I0KP98_9ACTO|nr:hypothetical protein [Nanchangia anserum]MBD3688670.1 hypothetical protein [Nanchangia anserum]QOX82424.1 hypothetical protein H8R18_03725 [Nanchangia anserum]